MIYKALKIFFICVKHGINPFLPMGKNVNKMTERFSENKKKWVISVANGYAKEYFEKIFMGD